MDDMGAMLEAEAIEDADETDLPQSDNL